jgi:hypothetical protein
MLQQSTSRDLTFFTSQSPDLPSAYHTSAVHINLTSSIPNALSRLQSTHYYYKYIFFTSFLLFQFRVAGNLSPKHPGRWMAQLRYLCIIIRNRTGSNLNWDTDYPEVYVVICISSQQMPGH